MRRRDLLLGAGLVLARPLVARAQRSETPVIGFLHGGAPEQNARRLAAYLKGLSEEGFVEGRNLAIEFRWAFGQNDKLPALAADLVQREVALIATPASTPAAVAAKAATSTIPIVFAVGSDPVKLGLVDSLSRPGGNATGVTSLNPELAGKRLGLVHDLMPQATRCFALVNPSSPLTEPFLKDLEGSAAELGIRVEILRASTDAELEAAFANLPQPPDGTLMVAPDSFFYIRRAPIATLAERYAVATVFDVREYVEAGGLISYGNDFLNLLTLAGRYTGRILNGEKPADLPVVQSPSSNW